MFDIAYTLLVLSIFSLLYRLGCLGFRGSLDGRLPALPEFDGGAGGSGFIASFPCEPNLSSMFGAPMSPTPSAKPSLSNSLKLSLILLLIGTPPVAAGKGVPRLTTSFRLRLEYRESNRVVSPGGFPAPLQCFPLRHVRRF